MVLGLSGGFDSAVSAELAVKAVGSSRVYALHLFDQDSQNKFRDYAQRVVNKLEINLKVWDITELVRVKDAYKPPVMRIGLSLPILNRWLFFLTSRLVYPWFLGESPFASTLKKEAIAKKKLARNMHNILACAIEEGFNIRHIQRKEVLETYAREKNLLLIGAANRSESFIGLFVKDGVDDVPIEPLLGLYKTQVRQLARFLDIPLEIICERPSPDMLKGIGDEDMEGFEYEKIDKIAWVLEHGLGEETALNEGITRREFEGIRDLNRLSAWKRQNEHQFPHFSV